MRYFLSFGVMIYFVGCISSNIPIMTDTNQVLWNDTESITIENKDSLSLRSMNIIIQHNTQFRGDTLRINIKTITPDSLQFEEHILVQIPKKRLSSTVSNEIVIPYRRDVVLKYIGDYRIEFTPSVATKGVEAIGVTLLPTKNN